MKHIKEMLDLVDKMRDYVALGLMSDPGLSKTSQINQWAEAHGRRVFELVISQRMPSEISGMPMPVNDTKKMEIYDFDTLLAMKDGDILFLDEFTNGNVQTLNACLTLIQDRKMLSGKKLPSIIVVAAGNPQGRCDLLPQVKQRFLWVNVQFDAEMWCDYIKETHGWEPDEVIVDTIVEQYRKGFHHDQFNYMTARTMENLLRIMATEGEESPVWSLINAPQSLITHLGYATKAIDKPKTVEERAAHLAADMFRAAGYLGIEASVRRLAADPTGVASFLERTFQDKQYDRVMRILQKLPEQPSEEQIEEAKRWLGKEVNS